MRFERVEVDVVDLGCPLQVVEERQGVLVLDPAALEESVAKVFVFSLDDEDLAAFDAHRLLPGLHVAALFSLLGLFIRRTAGGLLLFLGLLAAVS